IQSLRTRSDLRKIPERKTMVVFSPQEKKTRVWQLAPLSLQLLRLCDGLRTVEKIAEALSLEEAGIDGIPAREVCQFGLSQLCRDGLLDFSAEPFENDESSYDPVIAEATWRLPASQTTNNQQPWPPRSAAV